jgi:hypothetical protein
MREGGHHKGRSDVPHPKVCVCVSALGKGEEIFDSVGININNYLCQVAVNVAVLVTFSFNCLDAKVPSLVDIYHMPVYQITWAWIVIFEGMLISRTGYHLPRLLHLPIRSW